MNRYWFPIGLFTLLAVALLGLVGCSEPPDREIDPGDHEASSADLIGAWSRPDGGYILQIRSAQPDGRLQAGYFNPSPIQVGEAKWWKAGRILKAEVTLDDVNYRGSTYTLVYDRDSDQLKGLYYQAFSGESFEVFFVRRTDGGG